MRNQRSLIKKRKSKRKATLDKKHGTQRKLQEFDFYNMSDSELLNLLDTNLKKEQVILISEKTFGIPRGSILRRSKKQILGLIKNAINYRESLETIKERASK